MSKAFSANLGGEARPVDAAGEVDHRVGFQPSEQGGGAGAQADLFALAPEWEELARETPKLPAWLARVIARPSMQETTWEQVAPKAAA